MGLVVLSVLFSWWGLTRLMSGYQLSSALGKNVLPPHLGCWQNSGCESGISISGWLSAGDKSDFIRGCPHSS